ncbi:MAG: signal peptidase II [Armatimonadota bacterium]|nr:signal peptidase II [bacterium]
MATKKTVIFYALAGAVAVLDQAAKFFARRFLSTDSVVTVVPGFFDLGLVYNKGGAFGVLPEWAPLFIIVALVAIYAMVRLGSNVLTSKSLVIGLGLLMGGALGNLIDRVVAGKVTDFIFLHLTIGGQVRAWPTFNIADIAVVLGAFFVFYHVYIVEKSRDTTHSA